MRTEQKVSPFTHLCVKLLWMEKSSTWNFCVILVINHNDLRKTHVQPLHLGCIYYIHALVVCKIFSSYSDCMRNSPLSMYFLWYYDNGAHSHCYHRAVIANSCHSCPHCCRKWFVFSFAAWEKIGSYILPEYHSRKYEMTRRIALLQQSHTDAIVTLRFYRNQ